VWATPPQSSPFIKSPPITGTASPPRAKSLGGFFVAQFSYFATCTVGLYNHGMASGPIIDVRNSDARRPQFGLRGLFAAMAVLAVLFAVMGTLGPVASAGFLLVLAVVGLHAAGNALGTSLRDSAPTEGAEKFQAHRTARARQQLAAAMPPSRLYHRTSPGWIVWLATVLGCGVGGWLGVIELAPWFGPSAAGITVGAGSSAVLGAFFGFLSGSFLKMSLTAWWQASHVTDTRHTGNSGNAASANELRSTDNSLSSPPQP
jgi:hypothetical protein